MTKRRINNFIAYFNRTYLLKLGVITVILLGYWTAKISGDATALVFFSLVFGPMFFIDVKDNEEES